MLLSRFFTQILVVKLSVESLFTNKLKIENIENIKCNEVSLENILPKCAIRKFQGW